MLLRELLDAGDVVAHEADEYGLRRRLAVDPIFDIVAIGIAFAHFVVGLADGGDKLFTIHAEHWTAVLNGLLHFGRERVKPLDGGGASLRKIQERREELFQIVRRQVRHGFAEFKKDRAAHTGLHSRGPTFLRRGGLRRWETATSKPDLEMILPAFLAAAAAVHIHNDLVIVEIELGDLNAVSGVDGGAVRSHGAVHDRRVQRLPYVYISPSFPAGKDLTAFANSPETYRIKASFEVS